MENNVRQFVEGLGPGQLVSRQVLGSPCLGEVQLGLADRKGHLEVEVIRARGLVPKPGSKTVPGSNRLSSISLLNIIVYSEIDIEVMFYWRECS